MCAWREVLILRQHRVRTPGVHRELHRGVAEEPVRRPGEDGAGEDPQGSLGGAAMSPRSRGNPGGSARAIPRSRSRAASEAAASPL
jgi:hypothetical protein